jgi:hypothetical protein
LQSPVVENPLLHPPVSPPSPLAAQPEQDGQNIEESTPEFKPVIEQKEEAETTEVEAALEPKPDPAGPNPGLEHEQAVEVVESLVAADSSTIQGKANGEAIAETVDEAQSTETPQGPRVEPEKILLPEKESASYLDPATKEPTKVLEPQTDLNPTTEASTFVPGIISTKAQAKDRSISEIVDEASPVKFRTTSKEIQVGEANYPAQGNPSKCDPAKCDQAERDCTAGDTSLAVIVSTEAGFLRPTEQLTEGEGAEITEEPFVIATPPSPRRLQAYAKKPDLTLASGLSPGGTSGDASYPQQETPSEAPPALLPHPTAMADGHAGAEAMPGEMPPDDYGHEPVSPIADDNEIPAHLENELNKPVSPLTDIRKEEPEPSKSHLHNSVHRDHEGEALGEERQLHYRDQPEYAQRLSDDRAERAARKAKKAAERLALKTGEAPPLQSRSRKPHSKNLEDPASAIEPYTPTPAGRRSKKTQQLLAYNEGGVVDTGKEKVRKHKKHHHRTTDSALSGEYPTEALDIPDVDPELLAEPRKHGKHRRRGARVESGKEVPRIRKEVGILGFRDSDIPQEASRSRSPGRSRSRTRDVLKQGEDAEQRRRHRHRSSHEDKEGRKKKSSRSKSRPPRSKSRRRDDGGKFLLQTYVYTKHHLQ